MIFYMMMIQILRENKNLSKFQKRSYLNSDFPYKSNKEYYEKIQKKEINPYFSPTHWGDTNPNLRRTTILIDSIKDATANKYINFSIYCYISMLGVSLTVDVSKFICEYQTAILDNLVDSKSTIIVDNYRYYADEFIWIPDFIKFDKFLELSEGDRSALLNSAVGYCMFPEYGCNLKITRLKLKLRIFNICEFDELLILTLENILKIQNDCFKITMSEKSHDLRLFDWHWYKKAVELNNLVGINVLPKGGELNARRIKKQFTDEFLE